jgi:signal peptidase I
MKEVDSTFATLRASFCRFQSALNKNRAIRPALLLVLSIGSYLFMTRFVLVSVQVVGVSMKPTLEDGERRILSRWPLCYRAPRPGDLVVLKDPSHHDFAVKRVIGGPRDIILLHKGAVYVNGKELTEPYLPKMTETNCMNPAKKVFAVGKDEYFVLGDNRGDSEDSRWYGSVPRSHILGLINI